jgi:hypothetical protein
VLAPFGSPAGCVMPGELGPVIWRRTSRMSISSNPSQVAAVEGYLMSPPRPHVEIDLVIAQFDMATPSH